ncbi:DUF456 domain-containing protein [soil metagenome]|jgi:uncharacterized protein YqgC (DUF456 family)
MGLLGQVLVGLTLLVAVVGVVLPVLPGPLLAGAAIWVWAVVERESLAWTVAVVVTAILLASQVVKYVVPGRRMNRAGVTHSSLLLGAALGLVGFFVVPVIGLFLGFVAGIYLAERRRLPHDRAWASTVVALRAVGLSILIEMAAVLLSSAVWLGAVALG